MSFADDIALYALGYWSHEHHPFRINEICLNTKQRKTPCRACTEACPADIVLHSGKADWTGCTNCNLCITACPTSAINQSATSFEALRRLVVDSDSAVSFACERVDERCDVRCTCLATVPWDLAAAAALSGGVVLKADACKDCPHTDLVGRVKELVRTLQGFFGRNEFGQCVFLHDQPDRTRTSGEDKRIAFWQAADGVASGAATALSGQKRPTMSCYRALLLDVLSQRETLGEPVSVTWQTLVEDGNCRGCEICTKMCPHGSLSLFVPGYTDREEGNGGDSEGQTLSHNASTCTQCGLCYVSCPEGNLGGWDELPSSSVPTVNEWPIHVSLCEKCGRPFRPKSEGDTRCIACTRPAFSPPTKR